jgi:hypothetical protein
VWHKEREMECEVCVYPMVGVSSTITLSRKVLDLSEQLHIKKGSRIDRLQTLFLNPNALFVEIGHQYAVSMESERKIVC